MSHKESQVSPVSVDPSRTSTLGAARRGLVAGLVVIIAGAAGAGTVWAAEDSVSLTHARTEFEAGRAVLIDIREPDEHAGGVAAGAQLLPLQQIGRRLAEIPTDADKPVLLICRTQNRSMALLKALRERGYKHVRYVDGGMSQWVSRGWPTVAPPAR